MLDRSNTFSHEFKEKLEPKTWVIKIVAKYGLHDQMDPTIQTLKEKDYKLDKERVKE